MGEGFWVCSGALGAINARRQADNIWLRNEHTDWLLLYYMVSVVASIIVNGLLLFLNHQ